MMRDVRNIIMVGLFLVAVILSLLGIANPPATAMVNPAAAYCEALGYDYIIEDTAGGQRGLCQLPNGEAVDAWQFLKGKVGQEYSYCQQEGYEMRTVRDPETCVRFGTIECAVCVLEDGTEVEVTELMGLDFSAPGYYRMPTTTIIAIVVAAAVVVAATAVFVTLFIRKKKARLAAGGKDEGSGEGSSP